MRGVPLLPSMSRVVALPLLPVHRPPHLGCAYAQRCSGGKPWRSRWGVLDGGHLQTRNPVGDRRVTQRTRQEKSRPGLCVRGLSSRRWIRLVFRVPKGPTSTSQGWPESTQTAGGPVRSGPIVSREKTPETRDAPPSDENPDWSWCGADAKQCAMRR